MMDSNNKHDNYPIPSMTSSMFDERTVIPRTRCCSGVLLLASGAWQTLQPIGPGNWKRKPSRSQTAPPYLSLTTTLASLACWDFQGSGTHGDDAQRPPHRGQRQSVQQPRVLVSSTGFAIGILRAPPVLSLITGGAVSAGLKALGFPSCLAMLISYRDLPSPPSFRLGSSVSS